MQHSGEGHTDREQEATGLTPISRGEALSFAYAKRCFASANANWPAELLDGQRPDTRRQLVDTQLLVSDQCPSMLRCVVFKGENKAKPAERRTLRGSVLEQLEKGMFFLNAHNPGNRWPQTALRESLLNALEHRDYSYSGPTVINVFTTRIEIISLGGLVGDLQVNDLLNGVCQPRNQTLADIFERLGWCQNCGSGIQRIMDSYESSAISPQLRVAPSSVAMVLPLPVEMDHDWLTDRETDTDDESEKTRDRRHGSEKNSHAHSARRYSFPMPRPHPTHDGSIALAAMRVIGSQPMQIATLGHDAPGWEWDPTGSSAMDDATDNALHFTRVPLPQAYPLVTLEEVTLHVLARAGVPLSRAQIQETLGLNKNQAAHLLHTLRSQGKISIEGSSRATRYSLP